MAEEVPAGQMDINTALPVVIRKSLIHDGLLKGLNECAKALDRKAARLCILADDCDQAEYKKLVQALSTEHGVPILHVKSREKLGEWCGLCHMDDSGSARKTVKTSCCVITDFGEESAELQFVLNLVKSSK